MGIEEQLVEAKAKLERDKKKLDEQFSEQFDSLVGHVVQVLMKKEGKWCVGRVAHISPDCIRTQHGDEVSDSFTIPLCDVASIVAFYS